MPKRKWSSHGLAASLPVQCQERDFLVFFFGCFLRVCLDVKGLVKE
jgi:hypothetical protein